MAHMTEANKTPERRRDPEKRQMVITTGSWVRGVIVIALALALFHSKSVILILLASIVIASALEPATVWAKRFSIPRLPTVLAIYIVSALVFVVLFYFLFLPLLGEMSSFLNAFPEYAATLSKNDGLNHVLNSSGALGKTGSISTVDVVNKLNGLIANFSRGLFTSVSDAFGGVLSFILITILSFYLAVQEDGVGKFLKMVTPWKQERYIVSLWKRSQRKIGLWMQGQVVLALIIMVLVYPGLLIIGVDHALLLAVAAGFFEIVPLFGPIIAAIPAVLLAFGSGGMSQAVLVAIFFLIIHQFENQIIYPLVVKKVVGVPPMVSILALLVGAELAGFLGLLISVPMAAILMEFLSDLEQEKVATLSRIESEAL
jgi:predicted PurR-regulated permease PerM